MVAIFSGVALFTLKYQVKEKETELKALELKKSALEDMISEIKKNDYFTFKIIHLIYI